MDHEGVVEPVTFEWANIVIQEQLDQMGTAILGLLREQTRAMEASSDSRLSAAIQLTFKILRDARYFLGDPLWLAFVSKLGFKIEKVAKGFVLTRPEGKFHLTDPIFETSYISASDDSFVVVDPDYAIRKRHES